MALSPEHLRKVLCDALPGATVEIRDTTGGGDHFDARIVSAAFAGKSPIERHRLVYGALGDLMKGPIHALSLQTLSPEESR